MRLYHQWQWWFAITILLGIIWFSSAFIVPAYHAAILTAPDPSVMLLDRNGKFIATVHLNNGQSTQQTHGFWPLQQLPQRVIEATLALEDRRFWLHVGIDPIAIGRALWRNVRYQQRLEGASTLPMQIARMQRPNKRSYQHKLSEAITAIFLTWRYSRKAILKHYLRLVPYGNQTHGIAYASRIYFNKPVVDLSWAEIAFLSAIPQAPSRMNPYRASGALQAKQRGQRMLATLYQQQVVSENEYALATYQLQQLQVNPYPTRHQASLHSVFQLKNQLSLTTILQQVEPIVTTTLDINIQDQVQQFSQQALETWQLAGAKNVAAIIVKRDKRQILAWLGSQGYSHQSAGAIDFTQVLRSPGSLLKPFIFAQALDEASITPATILMDQPQIAPGYRNADHRYLGPLFPRQALANSRNIPAIALLRNLGVEHSYFFLRNLKLHDQTRPAYHYGLGMAIGALPTNLTRLVTAYGALANDGLLQPLRWIKTQSQASPSIRVMSSQTAKQLTLFLSDPLARLPSFQRMSSVEYPFPVAVKTGTSQGYRDAWTVAYSKRYLVGVWVGRHDVRPMKRLSGASSAAVLTQRIMTYLHQHETNGLADLSFPPPENTSPISLCTEPNPLTHAHCTHQVVEWLSPQQILQLNTNDKPTAFDHRKAWLANGPIHPSPQIEITTPYLGETIIRNPEMPMTLNSIALQATVNPPVPQVVWYIDGKPYQVVEKPYTVRWPLQPGLHRVQVKLPYREEVSEIVAFDVR